MTDTKTARYTVTAGADRVIEKAFATMEAHAESYVDARRRAYLATNLTETSLAQSESARIAARAYRLADKLGVRFDEIDLDAEARKSAGV